VARPKMDPAKKKSEVVMTTLTNKDRRRLGELVEKQDVSLASFLRSLIREAIREAQGG
jgi:hypothetical protein